MLRPILSALLCLGLITSITPAAEGARRSLAYRMPANAIEQIGFAVEHSVSTRATELPPEADEYDLTTLGAILGTVQTVVSGRIERTVARVFRDNSMGLVSRVIAVQASVDRGEGPQPVSTAALEGKSVSMRVLGSGELLASVGWEHSAGAGRGGDLVRDALLLSVLRLPYALPGGSGTIPSTFRLRLPEDALLNRDQAWTLGWTSGDVPHGCRRCSALAYTGRVTEAAQDRHPARPMDSEGEATVSGTIILDARGALVGHTFAVVWTRTVRSLRANGDRRAEFEQLHSLTGTLTGGLR